MKDGDQFWGNFAAGAAIVLLIVVAFFPLVGGVFVVDDSEYVLFNDALKDLSGLKKIWFQIDSMGQYYPLVYTNFWVEHHLYGTNPIGYHIFSIFLHSINSILLWRLLKKLGIYGAWLAAAFFAVHPVQVETLAWVAERKNTLSVAFYLLSFLTYLRFSLPDMNENSSNRRWLFYGVALFFYVLALLSKTATLLLPVIIILTLWWKKDRMIVRNTLYLTPMFFLGAIGGAITFFVEKTRNIGREEAQFPFSFVEKCLIAGRALWFYASKLICPFDLVGFYRRWQIDSSIWWQYLFPLSIIFVILGLWVKRGFFGKSPIAALLIFICSLAPALGFVNFTFMTHSFVANHFMYFACAAPITLVIGGGAAWYKQLSVNKKHIVIIACVVALTSLCMISIKRGELYQNGERMWRDNFRRVPDSFSVRYNLACAQLQNNNVVEAIRHLEKCVQLWPDNLNAHFKLAHALMDKGLFAEAVAHFYESSALWSSDPNTQFKVAFAFSQLGETDKALEHFTKGLTYDPYNAAAHNNLGVAYLMKGDVDAAINQFDLALQINPNYNQARGNLNYALGIKNNFQK